MMFILGHIMLFNKQFLFSESSISITESDVNNNDSQSKKITDKSCQFTSTDQRQQKPKKRKIFKKPKLRKKKIKLKKWHARNKRSSTKSSPKKHEQVKESYDSSVCFYSNDEQVIPEKKELINTENYEIITNFFKRINDIERCYEIEKLKYKNCSDDFSDAEHYNKIHINNPYSTIKPRFNIPKHDISNNITDDVSQDVNYINYLYIYSNSTEKPEVNITEQPNTKKNIKNPSKDTLLNRIQSNPVLTATIFSTILILIGLTIWGLLKFFI